MTVFQLLAFTVTANRLGVFMEDLLTSNFIEGFVFRFTNVTVLDIKRITQDDGWVFTGSLSCCRHATINSI